jgi:hypothetical protein
MNPMMKRLDAIEAAHAQQSGDCMRCYIRETDDETDEQARERLCRECSAISAAIAWPRLPT